MNMGAGQGQFKSKDLHFAIKRFGEYGRNLRKTNVLEANYSEL